MSSSISTTSPSHISAHNFRLRPRTLTTRTIHSRPSLLLRRATNPHEPCTRPASTSTQPTGPILARQPTRPLPPIPESAFRVWSRTLPWFILAITLSALAIFNYQKSSSSVVASILYALRRSERARAVLGDEIYFKDSVPWIHGTMNQLHGRIDINFWVKGREGMGKVRFCCERRGGRGGIFETLVWNLETEDGKIIPLLDEGGVMPAA